MDQEMMADEVYWGDRKKDSLISAWLAILDGGATTLMSGADTIKEHLTACHAKGYSTRSRRWSFKRVGGHFGWATAR